MFIFKSSERSGEFGFSGRQIKDALEKSQTIISFTPEGIILHANENFLSATGYRLEDIVGKHHSIFCEDAYTRSEEYKDFWAELREGKFQSNSFKRINRPGKAIYIQATYNPIHDTEGNVVGVIKYCTDITIPTMKSAKAVARTQASITFTPEGFIKDANETFRRQRGIVWTKFRASIIACSAPLTLRIHLNIKHSGRIWPRACQTQVNLNA